MRKRPVEWVPLGSIGDFPPDETRLVTFDNPIRQSWDGMAAHIGVYVRRQGEESSERDRFLVLAANCAHLGCPVSWVPAIGSIYVPLSWRRLLRDRRARLGAAPTWAFSLRLEGARWKAGDSGSALSDLAGYFGRIGLVLVRENACLESQVIGGY